MKTPKHFEHHAGFEEARRSKNATGLLQNMRDRDPDDDHPLSDEDDDDDDVDDVHSDRKRSLSRKTDTISQDYYRKRGSAS